VDNIDKKFLASPVLQSGIRVDWLERLLLLCEIRGDSEPQAFVWERMEANNHMLTSEGRVLQTKEENMAQLTRVIDAFRSHQLPLLRQLGVF